MHATVSLPILCSSVQLICKWGRSLPLWLVHSMALVNKPTCFYHPSCSQSISFQCTDMFYLVFFSSFRTPEFYYYQSYIQNNKFEASLIYLILSFLACHSNHYKVLEMNELLLSLYEVKFSQLCFKRFFSKTSRIPSCTLLNCFQAKNY